MVRIDGTSFGEVVIDGKTYYSDMIVWWDGKPEYKEKVHIIDMAEFSSLMKRKPEIIVIGTGQRGAVKITPEVLETAKKKKVEIYAEPSPRAVQLFNSFMAAKKKAVAFIHTTC
jgi:hypothetical protein